MANAKNQTWIAKIDNEWSPNEVECWKFDTLNEMLDFLKKELAEGDELEGYDFDEFFTAKAQTDLIVAKWGEHTLFCLKKGYRNILVESGLGTRERRNIVVQQMMIHPEVEEHIAAIGDKEYLRAMLGR